MTFRAKLTRQRDKMISSRPTDPTVKLKGWVTANQHLFNSNLMRVVVIGSLIKRMIGLMKLNYLVFSPLNIQKFNILVDN